MDPDRDGLDAHPARHVQLGRALRPPRADAAAPGARDDVGAKARRVRDAQLEPAQDPQAHPVDAARSWRRSRRRPARSVRAHRAGPARSVRRRPDPTWRSMLVTRPSPTGRNLPGAIFTPDDRTPNPRSRRKAFASIASPPPPGATTVLLVRHGESAPAHPDRPFALRDGHGDPALDPVGVHQAELLGERLHHETDRRDLRDHAAAHAPDRGAARGPPRPHADRGARPARGVPRRLGGGRVPPPGRGARPDLRADLPAGTVGRHPRRGAARGIRRRASGAASNASSPRIPTSASWSFRTAG